MTGSILEETDSIWKVTNSILEETDSKRVDVGTFNVGLEYQREKNVIFKTFFIVKSIF